jgi:hypothetical protein
MRLKWAVTVAALATVVTAGAEASVITTQTGTFAAFPLVNYQGAGPQTFDGGEVVWTSTNGSNQGGSDFGYNGAYGFGTNGYNVNGGDVIAGLNDSSDPNYGYGSVDSMTFTFAAPVASVGAMLNWVPNKAPVTISVYSGTTLLESLTLSENGNNLVTPDSFYGFKESNPEITSFVLTDGYVGAIGGLYIDAPAPEPATWSLMLFGLAGLGAALRVSRRKPSTLAA